MELHRRRMYGCEEEDAMTLFRGQADDVLNLYGNNRTSAAVSSATDLCHQQSQPRSSHVLDDEIEQAVALRHRRRQRQGVDSAATDAVLVARANQEVSRQNAEAAERNAEAAREHAELASAAPRVAGGDDDDDVAAEVAARRHRQLHEIAHLTAEGVAELGRRSDEAAARIIMSSFAAALLAPLLMAALLYYIISCP